MIANNCVPGQAMNSSFSRNTCRNLEQKLALQASLGLCTGLAGWLRFSVNAKAKVKENFTPRGGILVSHYTEKGKAHLSSLPLVDARLEALLRCHEPSHSCELLGDASLGLCA